jgi:hypothetical protein
MTRTALILLSLALAPLGGCVGGPVAYRTDPARTVRVPTALTGTTGQASTLILGVQ